MTIKRDELIKDVTPEERARVAARIVGLVDEESTLGEMVPLDDELKDWRL